MEEKTHKDPLSMNYYINYINLYYILKATPAPHSLWEIVEF